MSEKIRSDSKFMVFLIVDFSVVIFSAVRQELQSPRMIKDVLFNETHCFQDVDINILLLSSPQDLCCLLGFCKF